ILKGNSDGVKACASEHLAQLGCTGQISGVDGIDLRLRLRNGCARLESTEVPPVVRVTLGSVLSGQRQRLPHLHVRIDKRELRWHHADDGVALSVDAHLAADRIGVAEEPVLKSGAQYHDAVSAGDLLIVRERAAVAGTYPDEPEERRRRLHRVHTLRYAVG